MRVLMFFELHNLYIASTIDLVTGDEAVLVEPREHLVDLLFGH